MEINLRLHGDHDLRRRQVIRQPGIRNWYRCNYLYGDSSLPLVARNDTERCYGGKQKIRRPGIRNWGNGVIEGNLLNLPSKNIV